VFTGGDHGPPLVDLSISYPVMNEPPRSEGAVQVRTISELETAFATRFVGGPSVPTTI